MVQRDRTPTPFQADAANEVPVSLQLAWRLRALIVAGRLAAGDQMPSVRTMADWAAVNVNTVRGVYARLEHDGLVVTLHGRGTFVAGSTPGSPESERIAGEAIEAALAAGVDPRDVAIIAMVGAGLSDDLGSELPPAPPEQEEPEAEPTLEELAAELDLDDSWLEVDEFAARRELRRQIGRVEAQLASYRRDLETLEPTRPLHGAEPRVAGIGELERTRDALLRQLATARASAVQRAKRERRARQVRDAIVADPAAHRWEAVSATETGEPGCTTWQAKPRMGPLGVLMSWWRVKVSGGCP